MANRTVKVNLQLDVGHYVHSGKAAKSATKDFRGELAEAARQGDRSAVANERASRSFFGMARAANRAGDQLDDVSREALVLSRNIDRASARLRELVRDFTRTGDLELLVKIDQERATLSKLQHLRRDLVGGAQDAARAGITDMLGALPSQIRGALILALVGAGTAAAPLLGAVISAAVIGGIGAGGIAGGIIAASRHRDVQSAAGRLVDQLERPFERIGFAFVDPVVDALDILGDTGEDVLGQLRPELANLAPTVVDIAQGISGMFREALPGIRTTLREARPLLETFADELPGLGRSLGDALEIISEGGEEAAEGLRTLFFIAKASLSGSAFAIRALTEAFGLFKEVTDNKALLFFTGFGGAAVHAANKTNDATVAGESFASVLGEAVTSGFAAAEAASDGFAASTVESSDSMFAATLNAGNLYDALMLLNGGALAVRDAENQFQAAIDAANASLEEHSQNLDVATEGGRANREALDTIATSAQRLASAIYEETGSQEQATAALQEGRDALIETAIEMGHSRQKAEELADAVLDIPTRWTTNARFDDGAARRRLETFRALLADLDGTVAVTTVINKHFTQTFGANASTVERWGGVIAAQHGRLVPAHVTSSPTVLYGERATGQEAFVPKHGDPARSKRILAEAASWYGMALTSAMGGRLSGGGSGGGHMTLAPEDRALLKAAIERPIELRTTDEVIARSSNNGQRTLARRR